MNTELAGDADHLSLSRLVVESAWRVDPGQARTDAGWRFTHRS